MRPLHIDVDFDILSLAEARGRGIDDVNGRGWQSKLRREPIQVVLNGRRTAPVKNRNRLSLSGESFAIKSGQIVGGLYRPGV